MKIYLIERNDKDENHWDEAIRFVVVAANEQRAREIANDNCHDERMVWDNVSFASCRCIGIANLEIKDGLICEDVQNA